MRDCVKQHATNCPSSLNLSLINEETKAAMGWELIATKTIQPRKLGVLLLATLAWAPAVHSIPQWIDLGESVDGARLKVNFNSLRRDGQRIGFTSTVDNGNKAFAIQTWVDCDSWQYQITESGEGWKRIAANTMVENAAIYVCTKSKAGTVASSGANNLTPSAVPMPKGIIGKCTFLPSSGSNMVIDDSCKIDRQGNTTTLFWSDKIFTQMTIVGNQVKITSASGSPYTGRVVAKSSIGGAIEYKNGTIKWCWAC